MKNEIKFNEKQQNNISLQYIILHLVKMSAAN